MLQVVYVPQLATESLVFLTKTYLNQFQCPIFVLQNPEKSPFDPGEVPKTTAQGQHLSAVARGAAPQTGAFLEAMCHGIGELIIIVTGLQVIKWVYR